MTFATIYTIAHRQKPRYNHIYSAPAVGGAFRIEHVEAVGDGIDDGEDVFLGGFFAAGQVDDEGAAADAGGFPGEAAFGGDAHGFGAHGLGDAWGWPLDEGGGGFRGNVPR